VYEDPRRPPSCIFAPSPDGIHHHGPAEVMQPSAMRSSPRYAELVYNGVLVRAPNATAAPGLRRGKFAKKHVTGTVRRETLQRQYHGSAGPQRAPSASTNPPHSRRWKPTRPKPTYQQTTATGFIQPLKRPPPKKSPPRCMGKK